MAYVKDEITLEERQNAINLAYMQNKDLLDFPSPLVQSSGYVNMDGIAVPVWKPVANYRNKQKSNLFGAEATRISKVVIKAPSQLVEHVWAKYHEKRVEWDDRTCLDCKTVLGSYGNAKDLPVQWFLSKAKPFISPRDFIYSNQKIESDKSGVAFFVGGSLLDSRGKLNSSQARANSNSVRAYLQGVARVSSLNDQSCEVVYLLRCAPMGLIPQMIIDAVANELVYTLFEMKKAVEKMYTESRSPRSKI